MKKLQRGFTLIELLVVIAIIGILSSVVLASLNTARDKGANAAIKADLSNARSQANLYYDNNNLSYGTPGVTCNTANSMYDSTASSTVYDMIQNAVTRSGNPAACANDNANWVIAIPLKDGTNWCVDSNGYAEVTALPLSGTGSVVEKIACQ